MPTSIAEIIEAEIRANAPGMAVAVVHKGEVIHRAGYGLANLEWQMPITPTTVFRLASITKQFTAVAIMMLMEQGKLRVEEKLTQYFPDYPATGHEITLYHLLTHTSGIKSYTSIEDFMVKQSLYDLTPAEVYAVFSPLDFDFMPGTKWVYNNSGYFLLGMIIEQISGQSYAEFIEQHIFAPLGMQQSYYLDNEPIIPQRASGYTKEDKGFANAPYLSMKIPYAAGSLGSTIDDLVIWQKALRENRLISAETLAQMQTSVRLNDSTTFPYGFGWALNDYHERRIVHHGGGINGFSTKQLYLPTEDLASFVLANCSSYDTEKVAVAIARQVLGIPDAHYTPMPLDETTHTALLGTYIEENFGFPFEIIEQDGKIIVNPMEVELIWHGATTFHDAADPETIAELSDMVDGHFQQLRWVRPLISLSGKRPTA